jgi:hypothetical protein
MSEAALEHLDPVIDDSHERAPEKARLEQGRFSSRKCARRAGEQRSSPGRRRATGGDTRAVVTV